MRSALIAALLLATPAMAQEEPQPVRVPGDGECYATEDAIRMSAEIGEVPFMPGGFVSEDGEGALMMANPRLKTWSIWAIKAQGEIVCIRGWSLNPMDLGVAHD
ncbi:MAG TPA: hypothetical protein VNS22_27580 [Geminicoccus sp.]|uniref:hypothetical protein n=1 Tax=Geminicoccus sp. TaxID=2024832 RepID=UPI002C3CFD82|nr:hypothetical protein [Geminicoccus sp.]HWL72121.1 hypothetical protein [Geminicoccus sp.]